MWFLVRVFATRYWDKALVKTMWKCPISKVWKARGWRWPIYLVVTVVRGGLGQPTPWGNAANREWVFEIWLVFFIDERSRGFIENLSYRISFNQIFFHDFKCFKLVPLFFFEKLIFTILGSRLSQVVAWKKCHLVQKQVGTQSTKYFLNKI